MLGLRLIGGRGQRNNFDLGAVRRCQVTGTIGKTVWVIGKDAQFSGADIGTFFYTNPQTVTGKARHRRIIGGKDAIKPQAQCLGVKGQVMTELLGGQQYFGLDGCCHILVPL